MLILSIYNTIRGEEYKHIRYRMYTKKFTQMNFWYKMNLMKSQNLLPHTEDFDLVSLFY